jgi:hypothetical protein
MCLYVVTWGVGRKAQWQIDVTDATRIGKFGDGRQGSRAAELVTAYQSAGRQLTRQPGDFTEPAFGRRYDAGSKAELIFPS